MYFHLGKTKAAWRGRKCSIVKAEQFYALWIQATASALCHLCATVHCPIYHIYT